MENEKRNCKSCGQIVAAYMKNCPNCNALMDAPAPRVVDQPILDLQDAPLGTPAAAAGFPTLPVFPERMKANKALDGRTCTACVQAVELGDDVWNCQVCGNTMHLACHEATKVCGNVACASRPKASVPVASAKGAAAGAIPAGDTVPCKFCGEAIIKAAKKCRFCGEYQSEADRKVMKKYKDAATNADENLTGSEVLFGILCSGIACIVSIVWMIQGKGKGWKLFLISLAAQAVFTAIRLAAGGR